MQLLLTRTQRRPGRVAAGAGGKLYFPPRATSFEKAAPASCVYVPAGNSTKEIVSIRRGLQAVYSCLVPQSLRSASVLYAIFFLLFSFSVIENTLERAIRQDLFSAVQL